MTFRDWMRENHPEKTGGIFVGGCEGCPAEYFDVSARCHGICWDCWDREIPEDIRTWERSPEENNHG